MRFPVVLLVTVCAATARADAPKKLEAYFDDAVQDIYNYDTQPDGTPAPRVGFENNKTKVDEAWSGGAGGGLGVTVKNPVYAWSDDKTVAWVASDLAMFGNCCCGPCDLVHPVGWGHASMVMAKPVGNAGWAPVAFSINDTEPDKAQAAALKKGAAPPRIRDEDRRRRRRGRPDVQGEHPAIRSCSRARSRIARTS